MTAQDSRCVLRRAARRFPEIFAAIADGRHNLTTVNLLEPCPLPETARELLSASAGMSKCEVAHLLAARFPRPDLPTVVQPTPVPTVSALSPEQFTPQAELSAPARIGPVEAPVPAQVLVPPATHPRVMPLAPERYGIQVTVSKATHDKLRQAQALLSHSLPSGDIAEVLDRALDALIERLEKRRYGATDRPSARPRKTSGNPRHIAAHVRRAVRQRDGDQCTYRDDKGRRCRERKFLQLDHIVPVARGGEATVSNLRLRCRAHNQYEAECAYGAEFMRHKRAQVGEARTARLSADSPPPPPAT